MPREIKFRAWMEQHKVMQVIFDSTTQESWFIPNTKLPIMQYTGLKDSAGNEIYEGDIINVKELTFKSSGDLPENLNVVYYAGEFQLYRGKHNLMGLSLSYIANGEVIGNIYEHPELLER